VGVHCSSIGGVKRKGAHHNNSGPAKKKGKSGEPEASHDELSKATGARVGGGKTGKRKKSEVADEQAPAAKKAKISPSPGDLEDALHDSA